MNEKLLKRLKDFFSKEENKNLVGKPATDEQIKDAENILNVRFDSQYVQFIKNFGGAYAGVPIFGFSNSELLEKKSVFELTRRFRNSYNNQNIFNEINNYYVISIEGDGDPIMLDEQGRVIIYYHDSDEFDILNNSFEELIQDNFEEW